IGRSNLRRSREQFEAFLEKVHANPDLLARLDSDPQLAESAVDVFEHSRYFADQLIRAPELVYDLAPVTTIVEETESAVDAGEMRRRYRRSMLRIQTESILRRVPIFTTLERTSDLADAVVAGAYRLALAHAIATSPPSSASYTPGAQMMVIAPGTPTRRSGSCMICKRSTGGATVRAGGRESNSPRCAHV